MPKPRYDEEKDETRHAAVSEEYCEDIHGRHLRVDAEAGRASRN